ncbi:MAG: 23S rRNA (uracil(1939)-C(5))-methyltransferase RlmD [Chlamydiia bacterium]
MIEVVIHDISSKGLGVGRFENKVVFVEGALIGEKAHCTPTREGATIIEAKLDKIENRSKERVTPRCKHFATCGGCQLQHLSYEGQLQVKRKRVQDALERIGKVKEVTVQEVKPSKDFGYRNKLQLPVRNGKLGFFGAKSHQFIAVDHCHLHLPNSQESLLAVENLGIPSSVDTLVMKTAFSSDDILMILCSFQPITKELAQFADDVLALQKNIRGVYYTKRESGSNFVFGRNFTLLAGSESIQDALLGLKFAIYKDAFYQVNPYQVPHLYQHVLDLLQLTKEDRVLDAYCGVGTLALLAAQHCGEAVGIECVASSIESAEKNRELNQITNVTFHHAFAEEKIDSLHPFNVVILNPPRKGCDLKLLNTLIKQKVKKIAYVSCDPATFARDMHILSEQYELKSVQPFDLFPQTVHVETVGYLELK